MKRGYSSKPLGFNRKMVAASAAVTSKKSTIHSLASVDVTDARSAIRELYENTGVKLSFTAFIVHCLARVIGENPHLNSFVRRNRLITLEDVTVSVLVEREFDGEKVPEPVVVKAAQNLTHEQISDIIKEKAREKSGRMGKTEGIAWIRFLPGFLLKTFIRIADRNVKLAKKYGKIAVTAVGMFSKEPVWFIPHGSGTLLITVGSIERREVPVAGRSETREFLSITGSFDHDVIDGAPAARFMNQFIETLKRGLQA